MGTGNLSLFILNAASTSTGLTNSIYSSSKNSKINDFGTSLTSLIGSVGGICFTIAIMVIALVIMFGSISPKNIGRWWFALFSCFGGALLFFSAYLWPDFVSGIFS